MGISTLSDLQIRLLRLPRSRPEKLGACSTRHISISLISNLVSTIQNCHDTVPPREACNRGESMSDVASSPSSSTTEPGIQAKSQGPTHHGDQEKGEHVDQSGADGRLEIDRDVVDPASSTSINNSEDVLLQNDVQDQSAPAAFQNGVSPSVPNLSVVPPAAGVVSPVDTTAKPAQPISAPQTAEPLSAATDQAVTPSIAIPKLRLPHDRVGILEDRIKEDPRGDLEAWQNLIGEHRKRGKIEDARKVYERFLAVFPSAVSTDLAFIKIYNNHTPKGRAMGRLCANGE